MDDFLPVLDCYMYYDGPIFFKTEMENVQSIAMLVAERDDGFTYLVSPMTDSDIRDLEGSNETIRRITLRPSHSWVVRWKDDVWSRELIAREDIPEEYLSFEGTYLDPDKE